MMPQILPYAQIDRVQWAALVRGSRVGTWFQLPEAYAFYASLPHLFRPFALALMRDEQIRAVCVGYVTKEHHSIRQFFTRRAIIYGGPCLADDASSEEVSALMEAVQKHLSSSGAPIYIETRNFNDYHCWREAFEKAGFAYQPHLNFHIDCSSHETIRDHLSEVRRRQIKKAVKNGTKIVEASSEQEIIDWYTILKELYRTKVKTPLFPLELFLTFFRNGVGKYLLVKYDDRIIGGIMCLMDDTCIYEWFICGLDTQYKEQYPSVMAMYAAMDYAADHHLSRFDVMGAGIPGVPYGVRDFKAEFGGQLVEHGRFLAICHLFLYSLGASVIRMRKA